jgi:hypothetical protein
MGPESGARAVQILSFRSCQSPRTDHRKALAAGVDRQASAHGPEIRGRPSPLCRANVLTRNATALSRPFSRPAQIFDRLVSKL